MRKRSIWFVTPVHERLAMSRICLAQHAAERASALSDGVVIEQVVVGCDGNMTIAREFGSWRCHSDNSYLGNKFNKGVLFALNMGATHVVPLGSDTFIHSEFLYDLPDDRVVATSNYAMVREDGKERAHLQMSYSAYALPAARLLGMSEWCDPTLHRGCDTSMLTKAGLEVELRPRHPLELVSFRTANKQVSDYESYFEVWGLARTDKPFAGLGDLYPSPLVQELVAHYKEIKCT